MKSEWILVTRPRPEAEVRLFCLPYAGGGAAVFRLWPGEMPADIEVCRVQLPGRENRLRETPFTVMEELIPALVEQVRPWADRPYAIFGHSMGALVGFELARALRDDLGRAPVCLFASGYRAPQISIETPLHGLPPSEFVDLLRDRYEGIPRAVLEVPEILEIMLPLLRADLTVCERYRYDESAPLDCDLFAVGGDRDKWVRTDHLEAWGIHTARTFHSRIVGGNHFFLDTQRELLVEMVSREMLRRVPRAV